MNDSLVASLASVPDFSSMFNGLDGLAAKLGNIGENFKSNAFESKVRNCPTMR
jgi:hypothetical protein